jgi:hypothetical protein
MKKINILLFLAALVAFSACKDDDNTPTGNGTLNIELEHNFGADAFELNSANYYTTAAGEQVKLSTLKYYVSNIVLTKSDGTTWAQPESYYLVDASNAASTMLNIADLEAYNIIT